MLRELASHSITTNTEIALGRTKGDSGGNVLFGRGKVEMFLRKSTGRTNIMEKSAGGLKVSISLKGEKRLTKSLPSKGVRI